MDLGYRDANPVRKVRFFPGELAITLRGDSNMRKDLVDITLIADRSGSMGVIREDAEGGINQLIQEQKEAEGRVNFTLIEFDTEYEFVYSGMDIQRVGKYTLRPRGMTALLDAVGRGISETGERLRKTKKKDRPGLVMFVIVTDGHENSSREYTRDKIKEMIGHQRDEYNWQFVFLGADEQAFDEAISWGIPITAAAVYDPSMVGATYTAASSGLSAMRSVLSACVDDEDVQNLSYTFTDEDRESMTSTSEDNS
jgi:hypothetical protein